MKRAHGSRRKKVEVDSAKNAKELHQLADKLHGDGKIETLSPVRIGISSCDNKEFNKGFEKVLDTLINMPNLKILGLHLKSKTEKM